MSPRTKEDNFPSIRVSPKLNKETVESALVVQENKSEYIRKAVEQRNELVKKAVEKEKKK